MVKCGVLFEVRTELLNIIYTGSALKGWNDCVVIVSSTCIARTEEDIYVFSSCYSVTWKLLIEDLYL
jgi:hypothetical protein